jgi:hypothetical protein
VGPLGDRGPSSLDWAIELGARQWGVTALEANGDFDAGDVWATRTFPMRDTDKGSIYRHEVRGGAIDALVEAVNRSLAGQPPAALDGRVIGEARPLMKQDVRAIDWMSDPTDTVVREIRVVEGHRQGERLDAKRRRRARDERVKPASGLPGRGDGSLVRVLLRARPELPRGTAALRPQARSDRDGLDPPERPPRRLTGRRLARLRDRCLSPAARDQIQGAVSYDDTWYLNRSTGRDENNQFRRAS